MFKNGMIWLLVALMVAACGGGGGAVTPTTAPTLMEPTEPVAVESTESAEGGAVSGDATYQIVPAETEARFRIDEVLSGQDNTVVGVTTAVEGSLTLDLDNPKGATYSPLLIEASTFVTDNQRRNTAIQRFILQTGEAGNELITFQPTQVKGLPDSVEIGRDYSIEVQGDLTIRGITMQETFVGTVSAVTAERLEGELSTVTQWGEYGISIPNVPMVASVDEELTLEIDFVAERQF
ncbi:MAG: YceI family protein [Anaerolineales bacterium]